MLTAPLLAVFKNVSKPDQWFKKQFVAAAFVGFVSAYGAAGLFINSAIKSYSADEEDFSISSLFSWQAVEKYGPKGIAAVTLGYVGDIALMYGLAGVAYRRSRRKEGANPK